MAKLSRNEACPCGSGKKYKKCCAVAGAPLAAGGLRHTQADRASAFEQLDFFLDELWEEEQEEAFELFWESLHGQGRRAAPRVPFDVQ